MGLSAGQVYVPRVVLETLSAASAAPSFGVYDSYPGHGLSAARLPPHCQLRYLELGFIERYGWQALLLALALAAQSLLIAALLLQRRRCRAAELVQQAQRVQLLHAPRLAVAGELTASIAHEINQPLGAVLSNADAAPRGDPGVRRAGAPLRGDRRAGATAAGADQPAAQCLR